MIDCEFKVGDKVELIEEYGSRPVGFRGTVNHIRKGSSVPGEEYLVEIEYDKSGMIFECFYKRLKKVLDKYAVIEVSKTPNYISSGLAGEYASYQDALDSAQNLAKKCTEFKYYVVKLLTLVETEEPKVIVTNL